MTTWVTIIGNAADPNTHSGMQFYFHRSLHERDPEAKAMNLATDGLIARRLAWASSRVARLQRPGGFQYSRSFLEAIWSRQVGELAGSRIINFFQLYAPSVVARPEVQRWYYLDLTLRQVFDFYGLGRRLGRLDRADALARERDGYEAAAGVFAMSEFAAASLRSDYGLSADFVRVVPPGANIDADTLAHWDRVGEPRAKDDGAPVRVGFVGKDWRRKGLDRLVRGLRLARSAGYSLTLLVVGCGPEEVPTELREPWIEYCGRVDKRRYASEFVQQLGSCDVGCLLSLADASPIALREFHALGRPTVTVDVGGCREMVLEGGSIVLPADANDSDVADTFVGLASDRHRLWLLGRSAWERRREARWEASVQVVTPLLLNSASPEDHLRNIYPGPSSFAS